MIIISIIVIILRACLEYAYFINNPEKTLKTMIWESLHYTSNFTCEKNQSGLLRYIDASEK
jgi:hypothetical protein